MNFRKLCRIACVFFLLLFCQGNAAAVTIHGTVYEWSNFKPLNNTVVEINTTPEQHFVAKNAEYSFNLTSGTYLITANYFEGERVVYTANETVVVSDKGEYVRDLLLFPISQEELLNQDQLELPELGLENSKAAPQENSQTSFVIVIFFSFIALLLIGYFLGMRHRKSPQIVSHYQERGREFPALQAGNSMQEPINEAEFSEEHVPEPAPELVETSTERVQAEPETDMAGLDADPKPATAETTRLEEADPGLGEPGDNINMEKGNKSMLQIQSQNFDKIGLPPKNKEAENLNSHAAKGPEFSLPEDLRELLEVIRRCGNRITQRELRKKSPYSESKVSLMLSDLEERGLIEKFKRGRGNIIRIPDKHACRQKEPENKNE